MGHLGPGSFVARSASIEGERQQARVHQVLKANGTGCRGGIGMLDIGYELHLDWLKEVRSSAKQPQEAAYSHLDHTTYLLPKGDLSSSPSAKNSG